MAKTKQDYYKDGVALAKAFIQAGKMTTDGIPVQDLDGKPLNISMNGSWQAVAYRQGWVAGRIAAAYHEVFGKTLPKIQERFVCAKRARILKKRGVYVRFSHNTVNGKAMYKWERQA